MNIDCRAIRCPVTDGIFISIGDMKEWVNKLPEDVLARPFDCTAVKHTLARKEQKIIVLLGNTINE